MDKTHNKFNICQLFREYVDQRSVEAMTLFYKKISHPCFRMALKYTNNEADAEDIVQVAFIKILKNCQQYDAPKDGSETHLLAWCFSIVINEAKMNFRSEKSRNKRESKIAESKMQTTQDREQDEHDPKLVSMVTSELNLLPEKYKIPLSLKYIEGLKDSEIANVLQQNQNTTRSLIKRGIEKLSKRINHSFAVPTALLFALIKSQSLQAAPKSLNSFIDNSLKSRILTAKNSGYSTKLSISKTAAIKSKAFIFTIALTITTVGAVYLFKHPSFVTRLRPNESIVPKEIHQIWNYENEKERDFKIIKGNFKWNEDKKILSTEYDKPIWIELPLTLETQPLLIELKLKVDLENKTRGKLSLTPFLTRNGTLLPVKKFMFSNIYSITNENFLTISTYIVSNSIYCFYEDQCIHVTKFDDSAKNGYIGFLFKNYGLNQAIAKTVKETPSFVKEEMKKDSSRAWQEIEAISIDSINIIFND